MDSFIAAVKQQCKQKFTRTTLTTAKKSKKYRENHNSSPCISLNSSIDDTELDTGNDTDASVVFNSSQLSSTSNSSSCAPKQQCLKASSTQMRSHLKSVSVQNVVQCKSIQCQMPKLRHHNHFTQTFFNDVPTYGNTLLSLLTESNDFEKFAEELHNNNQTNKFVKTISSLTSGSIDFCNIAWKAALDMGHLFSCESTTQMEYDKEWLEFCQVLYHMFGAGVINALRVERSLLTRYSG